MKTAPTKRILFDFYAPLGMSKKEFDNHIIEWCLKQEQTVNNLGKIRLHVKETEQQVD